MNKIIDIILDKLYRLLNPSLNEFTEHDNQEHDQSLDNWDNEGGRNHPQQ